MTATCGPAPLPGAPAGGWHRRVWALAVPIMLSTLSTPLLGAVDTAVIGRLPDAAYIGGVAVESQILKSAGNLKRAGRAGQRASGRPMFTARPPPLRFSAQISPPTACRLRRTIHRPMPRCGPTAWPSPASRAGRSAADA